MGELFVCQHSVGFDEGVGYVTTVSVKVYNLCLRELFQNKLRRKSKKGFLIYKTFR
jgi:hypothetical protein